MSSSGNRVGIVTEYIRDAQDVTTQLKRRLTYVEFSGTPSTPYPWNYGNAQYLTFLFGKKECDTGCEGLPFQKNLVRNLRPT